MKMKLSTRVDHLLLLGAGASADYGLPMWDQLGSLIKARLEQDGRDSYQYAEEIKNWIDKVGNDKDKLYATIDRCICEESNAKEYHANGLHIENQIFEIAKEIFDDCIVQNEEGWLRELNEKILRNPELGLESRIAFVNYNYDSVLETEFLNFDHLSGKHRTYNSSPRLEVLSGKAVEALYAHGSLYDVLLVPDESHIMRYQETMKTGRNKGENHLDVVSCYESFPHSVETYRPEMPVKLYVLGLGGGLQENLSKLSIKNPVAEIHVTIKNGKLRDSVIRFLSKKFGVPPESIHAYKDCKELVRSCFND